MKQNIRIFSIVLMLVGLLFLLELMGVDSIERESILSYGLMMYGLLGVYFLSGTSH